MFTQLGTTCAMAKVFVVSGPSGAGKDTLVGAMLKQFPCLRLSVSATTRQPRPGEVNGRDYHFLAELEFEERVKHGDFIEHATFGAHRYGTLRSEVNRILAQGKSVVLVIDLQGARSVIKLVPELVSIFISPPDLAELRRRLVGRGTESPEVVETRLAIAEVELAAAKEFSFLVVNENLEQAISELSEIFRKQLEY